MTLAHIQADFFDHLRHGGSRVKALIAGEQQSRRLAIYYDAYRLRLQEALQENYPQLYRLLGDDVFEHMSDEYLQQHSPKHFSIRYFGDMLSDFLGSRPPYSDQPAMAQLAHFEWLLRTVFDAPDGETLQRDHLQHVAAHQWPAMVFHFHPSMRHAVYNFNIVTIWKALEKGIDPPKPTPQPPTHWLVWRYQLRTQFRSLSAQYYDCWQSIAHGDGFSLTCEKLALNYGEQAASIAAGFIDSGLQEGLFEKFHCQES